MKKTSAIISTIIAMAMFASIAIESNHLEEIKTLFFSDFQSCALSIFTVASLLSLVVVIAMIITDSIKKHCDAKLASQRRQAVRNLADGETYRDKGFIATRKGNIYEWRWLYKAPKGETFRERNARIRKETHKDSLKEVLYWI